MSEDRQAPKSASLADYAKHRGCSKAAVTQAIDAKKLVKSVETVGGKRRIVDVALADQEWAANSTRVTRFVRRAQAATPPTPGPAPPAAPPPSSAPEAAATQPPVAAAPLPPAADVSQPPARGELVLGANLIDAQMAYTNERTRKAWLENQQKEGRLVDRTIVAKEAFEADRIIREGLFNMSARISGKLAAENDPTKVALVLDAAVRECLTAMADQLVASHG